MGYIIVQPRLDEDVTNHVIEETIKRFPKQINSLLFTIDSLEYDQFHAYYMYKLMLYVSNTIHFLHYTVFL